MRRYFVGVWVILLLTAAAPALASANLLANGTFSAGFSPHAAVPGVVAQSWMPFVRSGTPPAFGEGPGADARAQTLSGSGPYSAGLLQRATGLAVGEQYRAGFEVYPAPEGTTSAWVGLDPLGGTDPAGSFVAWTWAGSAIPGGRRLEITFRAAATAATVFLRLDHAAGAPATFAFDNAYLRPAGEEERRFYLPLALRAPATTATPTRTATIVATPTATPSRTATPTITPSATATSTRTTTPTLTAPSSPPPPTATPTRQPALLWDPRLTALNVQVENHPGRRYQLVAAFLTINGSWEDVPNWARVWATEDFPERGGDHHAFGRCLDINGNVLPNKTFILEWPSGSDARTPEGSGWANIPISGFFDPNQGQMGAMSWYPLNGNRLMGLGLPWNHHYSFFAVWREAPAGSPTPTPTPSATPTRTPTGPTRTPTATATGPTPTSTTTGTPDWQYQADGMIVGWPNCSQTALWGTIRDEAGAPLAGVRVKVWAPEWGQAISEPSGADGGWRVTIANRPYRARWQAAVVDEAGRLLSPVAGQMYTPDHLGSPGIPTSENCSDGHQQININWKRRTEWNTEFVAASARFLSCEENHMNHNIYLWVVNRSGQGINGVVVALRSPGGDYPPDQYTGRDPYKPPGYLDYALGRGDERSAQVLSYAGVPRSSDLVRYLSNTTPPIVEPYCSGNAWGHYSYQVVFQARQPFTLLRRPLPLQIGRAPSSLE